MDTNSDHPRRVSIVIIMPKEYFNLFFQKDPNKHQPIWAPTIITKKGNNYNHKKTLTPILYWLSGEPLYGKPDNQLIRQTLRDRFSLLIKRLLAIVNVWTVWMTCGLRYISICGMHQILPHIQSSYLLI